MSRLARTILLALAVLAVVPALAAAGCAQQVIDDYQDNGRIDGSYSNACLQAAIDAVPTDAAQYTDINQVIQAAMGGGGNAGGGTPATTTPKKPKPKPTTAADQPTDTSFTGYPPPTNAGGGGGGPLQKALDGIGSKRADEIPTPVIVLGILAGLLVATGIVGFFVQRRRRDPADFGGTSSQASALEQTS